MIQHTQERTAFRIALALIMLLVVGLGVRSGKTVDAVLTYQPDTVGSVAAPAIGDGIDLDAVARRDSILAATSVQDRDPFTALAAAPKPKPKRVRRAPKIVNPTLNALLFDNVNPMVQISIAGERSGWLHKEEEFRGWRVTRIAKDSVEVRNKKRSVVLK